MQHLMLQRQAVTTQLQLIMQVPGYAQNDVIRITGPRVWWYYQSLEHKSPAVSGSGEIQTIIRW